MKNQKTVRLCPKGHRYYKSSDCPVCPICEAEKKPGADFLSALSAPARRALDRAGIRRAEDLSQWREKDLMKLHGLGPSSLPKLKAAIEACGLSLKDD